MIRRVQASVVVALTVAFLASLPVAGQTGSAPPLVITAYNGGPPIHYVTPRTPWGDPDLQGTWSSDDTEGIPRERPPALGTQLYQSDQEYAARLKQIQANVVNREQNATSTFRNDFARRAFRQTSIIVDPPDGRMPAFTRRSAEAPRAARSGNVRRRSVRHDRGLHALRPLHHPRHRRVGAACRLRQRQPHRAGPGHGRDQLRDDSRHARHVHGWPSAHLRRASASCSATRGRAGRATSSSSRRRT